MKKRALHGLGIALKLFSPIWLTMQEPPSYLNFGVSLALGILVLILASKLIPAAEAHPSRTVLPEPCLRS